MSEQITPPIELEFRRDENKFFVPPSYSDHVAEAVNKVCLENGCKKEQHTHPITRSGYYYFEDTNSMPPGFSVRYREYVDKPLILGGIVGESDSGYYEIKWLDQYESGRPIKRKLRIPGYYHQHLLLMQLRSMADELDKQGKLAGGVLRSLKSHLSLLRQDGSQKLEPLFIVEYERERYVHEEEHGKNVVSVDHDVHFYQTIAYDKNSEELIFQDLGKIDGCVVEYKESVDDTHLRWRLYRALVDAHATRFYGKKGEALNLLQRARSRNAPPIRNELQNIEVESKLDLHANLQQASFLLRQLYLFFENGDDFINTPGFLWVNSQSAMGTYVLNPLDPNIEGKILIGLDAKYSIKTTVEEESNGVLVRRENKGERFEYNRQKAREVLRGMRVAGKTQRIRRAFYVPSRETQRVYKISVDFNWKLPVQDNDFFSQLEIEYTGASTEKFAGPINIGMLEFEKIKIETGKLTEKIQLFLSKQRIGYHKGRRKVDILVK